MSASDQTLDSENFADISTAFCRYAKRVMNENYVENVPDEQLGRVLSAATRLFAEKTQSKATLPFGASPDVTATEVMIMVSAMLKALNLQPFELAMWQSWSEPGR